MKRTLKSAVTFSILSLLAIAPVLFSANAASAQTVGMDGSYIGGGAAVGVTSVDDEDAVFGGNIQGRVDVQNVPLSLRGAVLFSDETSAIMPIVSYDLGVAPNTNVYLGGGYSFVESDGQGSPLGNQDSVVLTAGAETAVHRNIVLYGDVKLGIDAYEDSSASAVSLQMGAAYRF